MYFLELNLSEQTISTILESPLPVIKKMLENKEISSVQLLHLYMKRALTIGRELHGITVENYNEAL